MSCGDFLDSHGIWSPKHSLEIFHGIKGSSPTGKCGRASAFNPMPTWYAL